MSFEVHFDRANRTLSIRNLSESEVAELLVLIGKWVEERRPGQALRLPKSAKSITTIEIKRKPYAQDSWLLRVPQDPRAVMLLNALMKDTGKAE